MITTTTFHEAYPQIIREVLEGDTVKPRNRLVKEQMCYQFCITDPTQPIPLQKERKMNLPFSFVEAMALFYPQSKAVQDMLLWYIPNLKEYMNDGRWNGFYGDRQTEWDQMERCYELLQQDPETRRAIISWFNPEYDIVNDMENKDQCCTLTTHFMIRKGKLDCVTMMRGNDVILGTPQNVFMNTFLQRVMAGWLKIPVGNYYHRVNSMHLYLDDLVRANEVMESEGKINHLFEKMGSYGLSNPGKTLQQIRIFFELDAISRKENIAGTKGERLRADLTPELRQVFDTVFVPYHVKRRKKISLKNKK